jgi:hypothetical protein
MEGLRQAAETSAAVLRKGQYSALPNTDQAVHLGKKYCLTIFCTHAKKTKTPSKNAGKGSPLDSYAQILQ